MKNPLRVISGVAAVFGALSSAGTYAAGTLSTSTMTIPPIPVTVTNTPSVSVSGTVPVSGSVSVTNPVSVSGIANPVTVQGAVNANITGGSVTATLPSGVTIANPATSPVLTSNTGEPGRTPYQAQQVPACAATSFFMQCNATFADVPAGKRLVVQNLSWFGVGYPTATSALLVVNAGQGQDRQFVFKFIPFTTYPYFSESIFAIDANMTFYADPGPLSVTIDLYSTSVLDQSYQINLTGYLIDCTVGPCAPIASQ